jgi:hypothetical protein
MVRKMLYQKRRAKMGGDSRWHVNLAAVWCACGGVLLHVITWLQQTAVEAAVESPPQHRPAAVVPPPPHA